MIEEKLSYNFKNKALLQTALTHSSYANELGVESNERLEFLGDAVLGCVVARVLYEKFPHATEGELSRLRGAMVSRANFARLARMLGLDQQILLGKGEEASGGRERESILAGVFEAVMGAVYIDGGYKKIYNVVSRLTREWLANGGTVSDYKTTLQEMAQKRFGKIPKYRIIEEDGPPHDRVFHVEVRLGAKVYGKGSGKSKKEAEQSAAEKALNRINFQFG